MTTQSVYRALALLLFSVGLFGQTAQKQSQSVSKKPEGVRQRKKLVSLESRVKALEAEIEARQATIADLANRVEALEAVDNEQWKEIIAAKTQAQTTEQMFLDYSSSGVPYRNPLVPHLAVRCYDYKNPGLWPRLMEHDCWVVVDRQYTTLGP